MKLNEIFLDKMEIVNQILKEMEELAIKEVNKGLRNTLRTIYEQKLPAKTVSEKLQTVKQKLHGIDVAKMFNQKLDRQHLTLSQTINDVIDSIPDKPKKMTEEEKAIEKLTLQNADDIRRIRSIKDIPEHILNDAGVFKRALEQVVTELSSEYLTEMKIDVKGLINSEPQRVITELKKIDKSLLGEKLEKIYAEKLDKELEAMKNLLIKSVTHMIDFPKSRISDTQINKIVGDIIEDTGKKVKNVKQKLQAPKQSNHC